MFSTNFALLLLAGIALVAFWAHTAIIAYHLKRYSVPGDASKLLFSTFLAGVCLLSLSLVFFSITRLII